MTERNENKSPRITKETKCECGHVFKSMLSMPAKKALAICPECGEFVELEFIEEKDDGKTLH